MIVPLAAVVGGSVLGFAYGYLVEVNPLVYLSLLATVAFGFSLGAVASRAGKIGKMRSPLINGLAGLVIGGVGLYVSWIAWLHSLADVWLFEPGDLWHAIQHVARRGAWSIKNSTPKGVVLYVIWSVEAALILMIAVFMAHRAGGRPFCEKCDRWAERIFSGLRFGVPGDEAQLKAELLGGSLNALPQLPQATGDRWTEAKLAACPACRQKGYFTVEAIHSTVDRKGKERTKRTPIVDNLILNGDLLAHARGFEAAQPKEPEVSGGDAGASHT